MTTSLTYSIPDEYESDTPFEPKGYCDSNFVAIYVQGDAAVYSLEKFNELPFGINADLPKFEPTSRYNGLLYVVSSVAVTYAGRLSLEVEPSFGITFIELEGVSHSITANSFAEVTKANGGKVPALLFVEDSKVRVYFDSDTFIEGGDLKVHLGNTSTYELRMHFSHTFPSYVTTFKGI